LHVHDEGATVLCDLGGEGVQARAEVGVLGASASDLGIFGGLLRHVYEKRPFKRREASEQAFTRVS
jgi:hypothetical protein